MKNKNNQNIKISNSNNFNIGNIHASINDNNPEKEESKKKLHIEKNKLKKMIAENDLQGVIDNLLQQSIKKDYLNQLIILNSRLNQVNTEKRINIISNSESQININNISNSLLQLIDLV